MYLLVGVIIAVCILLILWLWAIAPNAQHKSMDELKRFDYAHRGLFNNKNGIPENSLKAFRLAAESGFGIELDVQLTKDYQVVVHHDESLRRSCGSDVKLAELTFQELQEYHLFGTEEKIPLLSDVLKAVGRRVPLIVEIKSYEKAEKVCPLVWDVLKDYNGPYCMESFDPRMVRWFRKNQPKIIRGQLMTKLLPSKQLSPIAAFVGRNMLTNFLTRPDFEAYDFKYRKNCSLILAKTYLGMQEVSWTLRQPKDYETAKKEGAMCIFEGFIPNEPQVEGKKSIFDEARRAAAALITVKN